MKKNIQSVAFALVVLMVVAMNHSAGKTSSLQTEAKNSNLSRISTAVVSNLNPKNSVPQNFTPLARVNQAVPETPLKTLNATNEISDNGNAVYIAKANNPTILNSTPAKTAIAPNNPVVNGSAALIKDLNGKIIFKKNLNERWPMASLTKLMTVIIASENLNLNQKITLTDADIATEGESGGLRAGEVYTVSDLIRTALVVSSNDAAVALANAYGYQDFINLMQSKAASIGMDKTSYFDPTGLSALNQSTLNDLSKLVSFIFKTYPELLKITTQPIIQITELQSGVFKQLASNNSFAGRLGFLGGKTGYTDEANGNLISLFSHNGRQILIIIFGTNDRFGETEKLLNWAIK